LVSVVEEHGQVGNIVQRIKERELERQELLRELEDLRQAERGNMPLFVDRKTIELFLSNLRTTLNSGSPSERSAFLKAFVTRIDVWKEHGEINYRFPPEKLTVVWQLPPREFESLLECHLSTWAAKAKTELTIVLTRASTSGDSCLNSEI